MIVLRVLLTALAVPPASAELLRIAVISDLNGPYGSTAYDPAVKRAMQRIIALDPDLVISTGDMVAGQRRPHLARAEVEAMWAAFHAQVTDPLTAVGIALAVTPGNHDGSVYRGFELEREVYAGQWMSRRPAVQFLDDTDYPFRYAFALGDVLFVSLDATAVGPLPASQMDWLRGVLAVHGARYRQRVVFGHLPLWALAQGRESERIGDANLQRLFEQYAIDLVLSGHHHAFYPGSKDGVTFVGQACLGAGPRRLLGTLQRSRRSFTWVNLAAFGITAAAYAGKNFDKPIDWNLLPRRIRSPEAELVRADLVKGPRALQPAD